MSERPTNQQLAGMTPEQILGIMGGAGKEYEAYIPEYNRERENLARIDTQFNLESIFYGSQQAQAKSGFAGGGGIGKFTGKQREATLQGFQKQLEGFRSDYASDVYSSLASLAGLEAFKNNNGGSSALSSLDSSSPFGGSDLYGDDRDAQYPPQDPTIGQTWEDPSSGKIFTWDGNNWV